MKILFIYSDTFESPYGKYHEGIASLAAVLKQAGHEVRLLHITSPQTQEQLLEEYRLHYADTQVLACSITQLTLRFYQELFAALKQRYKVYTVCGGPLASLCPEKVMETGCFDALCRGDGEGPLVELCRALKQQEKPDDIASFCFFKDGQIIENPVAPLCRDISNWPSPDRSIYDPDKILTYRQHSLTVMAARGCPFNCSFCCNHAVKEIFPNRKDYIRYKNVERLLTEIKDELARCRLLGIKIDSLRFYDDLLITNKKWFAEFASRYKQEIALPYTCNCRFELIDDDTLAALKESGCTCIQVGLETGNEKLRIEVLNRHQSDKMIKEKAALCRKWGMSFHTYTMLGIPGEDMGNSLQTVKFAASIGATSCQVSVFYPFWATKLYDVCKDNGYLAADNVESYMGGLSCLNLPTITRKQIMQAHDNFHPFYQLYCRLYRLPSFLRVIPEKILDLLWYNFPLSAPIRLLYQIARRCR